jgi:hypothetical protein
MACSSSFIYKVCRKKHVLIIDDFNGALLQFLLAKSSFEKANQPIGLAGKEQFMEFKLPGRQNHKYQTTRQAPQG